MRQTTHWLDSKGSNNLFIFLVFAPQDRRLAARFDDDSIPV